MLRPAVLAVACLASQLCLSRFSAFAHEGPDPVSHWFFSKSTVADG